MTLNMGPIMYKSICSTCGVQQRGHLWFSESDLHLPIFSPCLASESTPLKSLQSAWHCVPARPLVQPQPLIFSAAIATEFTF